MSLMPSVLRNERTPVRIGGEEGFTLLEVLIASIILAIALMAIAVAEVTSVGTNRLSRTVSQATSSAEEIIERMRRNRGNLASYNGFDTNNAATRPGAAGTLQTDYDQWQARMLSGGRGQVSVASGSPITGASLVTVTITWTEVLPRTVTLQTTF